MKKENLTKQKGMVSLNNSLYEGFSVEELEERLETAPWVCGGYVDADIDIDIDADIQLDQLEPDTQQSLG